MTGAKLNTNEIASYVTAGRATFTVVLPERETIERKEVDGKEVEEVVVRPAARYTFRVRRPKKEEMAHLLFVDLLTGSSNEDDFSFAGTIFPDGEVGLVYRHSKKSRISDRAPSIRVIETLVSVVDKLRRLGQEKSTADMFRLPELQKEESALLARLDAIEVWHEGRCGRCGRKLTVPESIATGLGPDCAEKV